MSKRRWSFLVVLLLLSMPGALLASGASAGERKPEPAATAVTVPKAEAPFTAVGDAVSRVNAALVADGVENDVALAVTYDPDVVIAHTQLPADSPAMERARSASAPIEFSVHATKYAVADLVAEAKRLVGEPGVSWASPSDDYSAVKVSFQNDRMTLVNTDTTSTYPLAQEESSNIVAAASSRNADTKPVYGGALIWNASAGQACSAGIGVTVNGENGFTTAQHCSIGTWTGFGSGVNVGTSNASHPASVPNDIRFVRANAKSRYAWTGGWNSTSAAYIYSTSNPANNQRICTSGGVTAEVCGETYVRGTNTFTHTNPGWVRREPGFWILTEIQVGVGHRCIVNGGDSGSPAYNYTSNGYLEVRGFVIGSDPNFSTAYCPGMNPNFSPNPTTSSRAFAVNVTQALNSIGATQ